MRYLVPTAAVLVCSSAYAVPYTLSTSTDQPYAKLTQDGATVCATWLDGGACDVPAGDYRLHRFDRTWADSSSAVTIDESTPGEESSPVGADCPAAWAATLQRMYDAATDFVTVGALDVSVDEPGFCATGRQEPDDAIYETEVQIISAAHPSAVLEYGGYAEATLYWQHREDSTYFRDLVPLTDRQARSCAVIAGCSRF